MLNTCFISFQPENEETEVITGVEDLKENDAPEIYSDKKTDEVIGKRS